MAGLSFLQKKSWSPVGAHEEPIRGELYSVERLEQFASALASEHTDAAVTKRGRRLLPRLAGNGRVLVAAYRALAEAIRDEQTISPAAEWLVDNFHIVEEQLREIREDLPPGYYAELPKLQTGDLAGYPRIYAVALSFIAHTDSRVDAHTLQRFIQSYQHTTPLLIGELWAIAITLRLALVENLRRLTARIVTAREEREAADKLADRLLEIAKRAPEKVVPTLAAAQNNQGKRGKQSKRNNRSPRDGRDTIDAPESSHSRAGFERAFVVQLAMRLRDQDPEVAPALDWLDRELARENTSVDQAVNLEHGRQAAAQVTVGNIITSMRLLSTLDWRDFFESVSLVDPALADDPANCYHLMDFATRDRYRHVVERIGKRSRVAELDVARHAVELAKEAHRTDASDTRRAHVGYYLVDRGLVELEKFYGYRPRSGERVRRVALLFPTPLYFGSLLLIILPVLALLILYASSFGAGALMLVLVALLALIPASDFAVGVVNLSITKLFAPRTLSKLDFSEGVPDAARTMIVIPTMLTSEEAANELCDRLEIHYLANRDDNIYFALLTDFADAPAEEMPGDAALLDLTLARLAELNRRYGDEEEEIQTPRFFLFHRRRLWNPREETWMGWERKRGKLHEFNRLLRGAEDTSFVVRTAKRSLLAGIKFVITLDSDTRLPRGAARVLVGAATHPLNRPRFDAARGRVTEGYGVLQPRVSIAPESGGRSTFARIFSGNTGVDPYTTAVSDVYQDLWGRGSYTGKGLYDVDAFEAALRGRVPENSLVSHDLFEGMFARTALVTDAELFDDYPARYDTYAMRQHRWTRGDWQIARWLLPRIPDTHRHRTANPLPFIARWKILDNLRRSLSAPTCVLMLVAGWTVLPGAPALWTLFVLLALAFPIYAHVTTSLFRLPRGVKWTSHVRQVWSDFRTNTMQVAFTVVFLAHQAYLMTDAILRSLYRQFISRRRLLEWTTAAQAESVGRHRPQDFLRFMWQNELLAAVALLLVAVVRPSSLVVAVPLIIAWLLAPLVAFRVSRPTPPKALTLDADDERRARLVARRTWRFFETFVTSEDNWLPPDNFQEDPQPVIAHRTSPTNIGLLLLSSVAARDFGYTATLELAERLELTFATLDNLERFDGHLLNWYDTRTLAPLAPRYVSTVDSGNLAGHLIALKVACLEIAASPLLDARVLAGFADTIALLRLEAGGLAGVASRAEGITLKSLRDEIERCARLVMSAEDNARVALVPETPGAWFKLLDELAAHAAVVEDIAATLAHAHLSGEFTNLRFWANALLHQARQHRRDLETLLPSASPLLTHFAHVIEGCSAETVARWREATLRFDDSRVCVGEIPALCAATLEAIADLRTRIEKENVGASVPDNRCNAALNAFDMLTGKIKAAAEAANNLLARYASLARRSDELFAELNFRFLFDEERKVFAIGYNVSDGRPDNSFYDLLASEARLASFVAVAKGEVEQEHWFRLGRGLTPVDGSRALISWTATMFEYLMPLLVMRRYPNTLLDETYAAIVRRQIEYGRERGVPWGVSESAYNARDLQLNYQYAPFGIPGLGLKRGLSEDLVISPYSTLLAAMIAPQAALTNLARLEREGALSTYGFYESIDYTSERLPQNRTHALIRCYMAHHQGMSFVALDNLVNGGVMQHRFHADPLVQATELVLQERVPRSVAISRPRAEEVLDGHVARPSIAPVRSRYTALDLALPTPRTQLLSNGAYTVMMTNAGAGFSACAARAVTRWREDVTRDAWGSFCYLRDAQSGAVWSAGFQPTRRRPQSYEVAFTEDKAEIWRRDGGIVTHTEIIVSPEDNSEVRRVSLTNTTTRAREIELTSYMEIVLNTAAADIAHPAFSNLFIETEFVPAEDALLARRRPRSEKDEEIWGVHTIVAEGEGVGAVQYETDRSRFLGRGRNASNPVAVAEDRPLSNTTGAVLDPVFSLRQRVRLAPNETARVTFATAVAGSRDEALRLADKYHDASIFEREASLAWTRAQVQMRHLNVDAEEAHLFQRLAGRVLYADSSLRPRSHVLALNTLTQSALWQYGISGDLPIVLVRIGEADELPAVRQILRAHEYLRLKGLTIDLVILNDHPPSYAQTLQDELQMLIRTSGSQAMLDKPGGVFLRRTDIMPEADRILLHTIARVVLVTNRGTFAEQLTRRPAESELPAAHVPRSSPHDYPEPMLPTPELAFFNGLGGFREEGSEYVTVLGENQWTPAPWTNVVANREDFGFIITESGGGYTWSNNSRENRLTTWSNDAVSDPPSEVIYLRDEDSGTVWTPTPLPVRESEPYTVRHGQGYTVFEHTSHGIRQELLVFAPVDAQVKVSLLRLRNLSGRRRKISVTSYMELVLGVNREQTAPFINTEHDEASRILFATNPYNNEFADRVAFACIGENVSAGATVTCDRKEFLGRNGSLARPAALRRAHLSGATGAGLDPCFVQQTIVELQPDETREIVVLLGQAVSRDEARQVCDRFRRVSEVNRAFEQVLAQWDEMLDRLEVRTPDASFNAIMSRWLLYQTLACRVRARSAFYQSGGAYGFRDQLQDVCALVYSRPDIAREQILRAARHQFKEGDVLHWWHPPTGRGVRTRFSDDLLWLPYVTSFYVQVTGDKSVLDERVPFIEAPLLVEGVDEFYLQPTVPSEDATIYEHCARTIDRSLKTGRHGLPLMGSGDWNDGMNRVGHEGEGESVWVGWFLYTTIENFVAFCDERAETARAKEYRAHLPRLKTALEENAWDGDWYRRAYFDDGTPLGSVQNEECRIDSIAQSWGVISGAADSHRAARALASVEEYLIRRGDGLVLLFTPPFDKSALNPGYIKGYVPGVRENGGQYTHAALWTLIAYARLGDGDRAGELFALLNPVNHSSTRAGMHRYKVEPYVAAGDVYAVPPHTGRGGWTWYTGSSGWMYRAGLEDILGFHLRGDRLTIEPCIPRGWREFEISYRHGAARYHIRVENPHGLSRGVASLEVDGVPQKEPTIMLSRDEGTRVVRIALGHQPLTGNHRQSPIAALDSPASGQ